MCSFACKWTENTNALTWGSLKEVSMSLPIHYVPPQPPSSENQNHKCKQLGLCDAMLPACHCLIGLMSLLYYDAPQRERRGAASSMVANIL